jgi:hypothetical protein
MAICENKKLTYVNLSWIKILKIGNFAAEEAKIAATDKIYLPRF